MTSFNFPESDVMFCDVCDNMVRSIFCKDCGEDVCGICHEAYPEDYCG